ncbi:hypothetical protein B0H16DRAFT_1724035 [Mycena metata]|uniref:Uncharacterized protein n=1 Tax=Mycena metata TaxID=1033252 RepID=A0AAD7IW34_9AGAR|nr:hypothetical protein B0H16DRAFT_1724035 [Mycena metata]
MSSSGSANAYSSPSRPTIPPPIEPSTGAENGQGPSVGGTTQFVSAMTSGQTATHASPETSSVSSGERTTPPDAPTGLTVRVQMDTDSIHYVDSLGGDVDDPTVPLDTPYYAPYQHPNLAQATPLTKTGETPSSTSDLQFTASQPEIPAVVTLPASGDAAPVIATGESALDNLFRELQVVMTPEQKYKYSAIRGMLSTGRTALLSTTAFVAGQRTALAKNARSIERVREDTEDKLQALHEQVMSQDEQVEYALNENLRVLLPAYFALTSS